MPAFDIINNTKYEINDWKQLIGLTSNLSSDVKIAVNSYNCNVINCTTIVIYMESASVPLTSFVISGTDSKQIKSSKVTVSRESALSILNDFGFPVAQKITFHSMKCTTYAQYSDVVEMVFTPYRKRSQYKKYFYNCSLMIFEGWQELKEEDTHEVLRDNGTVKTLKSKYACFDSRYIEDLEKVFKNAVVTYKKYEVGTNGRVFA